MKSSYFARVPLATRCIALLRETWARARRERSTPREIGLSVGLGAFVACSPLVGFHLWIALALATVLRLNRLWAMIGSRLSLTPIFLVTTFVEIQTAHYVRTRTWAPITLHTSAKDAKLLAVDWAMGFLFIGSAVGAVAGLSAASLARRWPQLTPSRLAGLPPPSSESPP